MLGSQKKEYKPAISVSISLYIYLQLFLSLYGSLRATPKLPGDGNVHTATGSMPVGQFAGRISSGMPPGKQPWWSRMEL